ncbi:ACT domain-containing protein [Conchiformibius kuhniae]|uniref:ACT domain-containing protein n=1 Tax=Conchiformibius kuhniae TaxID=211502 RepID=A0A8T9MRM3_9NEIS|nr:ACT domain-containing protein [Conchiformibius kuhniae]UOP04550.1 ACT domain-containing protein [Conchiformibius kuhniae]
MNQTVSDLPTLLQTMQPVLREGIYCFSALSDDVVLPHNEIIVLVREAEGVSVIVHEQAARCYGLQYAFRAAWITLNVYSDLQAVGLTAAVAQALAQAGIACNVVAGLHHDHVFVPHHQANAAMSALTALQQTACQAA